MVRNGWQEVSMGTVDELHAAFEANDQERIRELCVQNWTLYPVYKRLVAAANASGKDVGASDTSEGSVDSEGDDTET
jgi:hypothetical protein